jgi:hypothetical protein
MCTKLLPAASAAILLSLMSLSSASAEGGCGPGWHRNAWGHCRPNGGPVVVAPAPVVCSAGYRWHPRWRRCVVL